MIKTYFKKTIPQVDKWIDECFHSSEMPPREIHEAMRYMMFSGGKRIRPILALAACEACGGLPEDVSTAAVAIEAIHTYSLVHDDLPCMDDDDFRRGKPTCHKKYGEFLAVLTGDALLTYAFELLSTMDSPKKTIRIISELSKASGSLGMIGGQVVDKQYDGKEVDLPALDYINVHKTGKLITVSCLIGAIAAGASKSKEKAIVQYGEYLGFAFQVVDDILDGDGYLRFMGKHEAFERAEELVNNAKAALAVFGNNAKVLRAIADFVLKRGTDPNAK